MLRVASWVSIASIAAGCACGSSHEVPVEAGPVDAALPVDAATAPDAATDRDAGDASTGDGHYFTLEPALVDLFVVHERCAENEAATVMLRVTVHFFDSCDSPGPVEVRADPATHTVLVTPHLWLEHGGPTPCMPVGAAYERDVAIQGLTAGTWTIDDALTIDVGAPPPPVSCFVATGTVGTVCTQDCDCTSGLRCLAIRGDAVCQRQCADPCETVGAGVDHGLECAPGDRCTSDPNLGWTCGPTSGTSCSDTMPCPAGMACTSGACAWTIALNGAIRHDCHDSADCDAGLDCVQAADGLRRCDVRCSTSEMLCPSMHACDALTGVCEWLGE